MLQESGQQNMLKIDQIKVPVKHTVQDIIKKTAHTLGIMVNEISDFRILKRSLDARKKPELYYVFSVAFSVKNESKLLKRSKLVQLYQPKIYEFPVAWENAPVLEHPPVIIGAGPAGLFAAYALAKAGYCPVIVERGGCVEERQKDVELFWKEGILSPNSNIQFGEGGAGTFSDGKLNTLVKDSMGRNGYVLETFVKFGAKEDILYDNKPHIGTDVLVQILIGMRHCIEELGGTFLFHSQVTKLEYENNRLNGVTLQDGTTIPANVAVLSIGHSARDTFAYLTTTPIEMSAKSFAVGFRVEHLQKDIDLSQYGTDNSDLPAAAYKLTAQTSNNRGVYSFCMCPGGYVVNASSVRGMTCVNGMSYSDRAGKNANSAIIVSVTPEDFDGTDPLAGVRFQEHLEKCVFDMGMGKIVQQRFEDYKNRSITTEYGKVVGQTRGETCFGPLHELFSEDIRTSFLEGMEQFGRQIKGFDDKDAILSGVESRTSSPVRISRNDAFESCISGLYPCGEGAGYAGGIMSAAMDGLKVAEAIAKKYKQH